MIEVSYLQTVYPKSGKLDQAKINFWDSYETFEDFVTGFWKRAKYLKPQSGKYETYAFAPTLFEESEHVNFKGELKHGHWRNGAYSAHVITLMYLDIDNANEDFPLISLDTIEAYLRSTGLAYLIYTTYSHTPERHKVRVLLPISRDVTYPEAYALYTWFDERLGHQLDGTIYDDGDHLYGPPYITQRRQDLKGDALQVDPILACREIPAAYTRQRPQAGRVLPRQQMADLSAAPETVLSNPRIFNPAWFTLLEQQYAKGHNQTILGLLAKVWHKSGGTLSFGDLSALQTEMDGYYGGYCRGKYGQQAMARDVRSVMCFPVEPKKIRTHNRLQMKPTMKFRTSG